MSASICVSSSAGGDGWKCSGSLSPRPHRQYMPSPSESRHVLDYSPRPSSNPSRSNHFSKASALAVDPLAGSEAEMVMIATGCWRRAEPTASALGEQRALRSSSSTETTIGWQSASHLGCWQRADPAAPSRAEHRTMRHSSSNETIIGWQSPSMHGEHRALRPSSSTQTTIGWQSASHLDVNLNLAATDRATIEGKDRSHAFANVLSWMAPLQEQTRDRTNLSTAMPLSQKKEYLTPAVFEQASSMEKALTRCKANKTANSLFPPPELHTSPSVDFKTSGPFQWANIDSTREELDAKRSTSCDSCERFSSASTDTGSSAGSDSTKDVFPPIMARPKDAAASVADAAQVLAEETDDMVASAVLNRCLLERSCKRVNDSLSVASSDVGAVLAGPDIDVAADPHHASNIAEAVSYHKDTFRNLLKVQKHCMQIQMLIQAGSLSN